MRELLHRIEEEAGIPDLANALAAIDSSDLHSLLLTAYRSRAAKRSPAMVLADYESSRFVHAGGTDPREILEWDRVAFSALSEGFVPIELSPLCPLATCSAVATVSQDKSVVTVRGLEVVSDLTNVLALECAVRRRALLKANPRSSDSVRPAASQRMVRPQFSPDPRMHPHFRLFGLCSAGRAQVTFLGPSVTLRALITDLNSERAGTPQGQWLPGVISDLGEQFPQVDFLFDPARTSGRGYYRDVCFKIHAAAGEQPVELSDGGAVDWTQKLLSNAKERLFISGIGSERVCSLRN